MRREFKWMPIQQRKLNEVKNILNEWKKYLPLTLRQVYYQLVSKEIIKNKISEYNMLSKLLKWARIDGKIPWGAIEDRVRAVHSYFGFIDKNDFVDNQLNYFLEGYRRDLMNEQRVYIEVWIEKDALSSIFSRITRKYCISTVVCRGFSSVTFLNDFKNRCNSFLSQERNPIMLYFGDFDPSGFAMLPAMLETIQDEMDCDGIEYKRIALTKQDIHEYNLPHDPNAVKQTDTRYTKFVQQHGEYAVELDALPPDILENKIIEAIENEIDLDLFAQQKQFEEKEIDELIDLKREAREHINDLI